MPAAPVTPSLAPGAEENAAFELLNNERLNCGFGPLARNSQLDQAARGHANWMLVNNGVGHYQRVDTQGFTGVTPNDRTAAAGYVAASGSDMNMDLIGRTKASGFGTLAVHALLSAPYHLVGMMGPYRDVGMSVMSSDEVGTSNKLRRLTAQFDLAVSSAQGLASPAVGKVLNYPCQGTKDAFTTLSSESPNPLPGRDLTSAPVGHGIYVVGDTDKQIAINSASIQETVTGNTVSLLAPINSATDPNNTLKINEAIVLPDTPLKAYTEYAVMIVGINDGTSFTKSFKFKTGSIAQATSAPQ